MNNEPTVDQLKDGVNLVDYIGQHVTLKKQGVNHFGCCPLHGEKTPSFTVREDKQFFYCFGCGASGSVIDFIMAIYGVDTAGAIDSLKLHLGIKSGQRLEVVRRLTKAQENAERILSSCEIVTIDRVNSEVPDACAELSNYGIFLDTCYASPDGALVLPLRSKKAVEDLFVFGKSRGIGVGQSLHDGYAIAGNYDEHSLHLYLCADYIDAIYLHKISGGNSLIIFTPHINYSMETIKRDYPNREIRLALSNTDAGQKLLETFVGRYVMPDEIGFFCEKDRKQKINGVKNAR